MSEQTGIPSSTVEAVAKRAKERFVFAGSFNPVEHADYRLLASDLLQAALDEGGLMLALLPSRSGASREQPS